MLPFNHLVLLPFSSTSSLDKDNVSTNNGIGSSALAPGFVLSAKPSGERMYSMTTATMEF
jgi:hypothetical protein